MTYADLPETTAALEEGLLGCWTEEETFRKSLERREGSPEFVFYEGPPTANGRPGVHHIFSRTIKDLVGRYRTMVGCHVTRIAGWDTHGLPVEIEAEKQLGISGKGQIEEVGIGEFNRVCRENIFTYKEDWERLSLRIGYWLDYADPYVTCSPEYIESCWWALKEIDRRGLLYRGYRVVPYCPRCGTGLSSHEVAQGYREVSETAAYVKFHLLEDPDDARILSWTTTPWTLPGNLALAVGEGIEYARVRVKDTADSGTLVAPGEVLILARERMDSVLRNEVELLETLEGRDLVGLSYRPLFPGAVDGAESEAAWTVAAAGFVSTEEGTGVVHTAVMYGEEDFELGRRIGLPMEHTVDAEGRFVGRLPEGLAGRYVKAPETEEAILDRLRAGDFLYRTEKHRHTYPHCWRCESPLLYMARDSWYLRTTAVKDRLLAHNASVAWHPPEIGRGRMEEWLENNVDWALSRDRYWGTPLPIWVCDREPEHREVIGSFRELAERTGGLGEGFDPHRPEIDGVGWACATEGCEGRMRRVRQVADAWYDSGSMPYAQWHYPFEREEEFSRHFPADFIAEGVDQTRGWFYSLLALSTLLFDRAPYRAVVVNDLVLDADGQKMSKSRGNVVDPWETIEAHGADAVRLYLVGSSHPWIAKRWDPDGIREVERKLLDTLRNTYRFFALYAGLEGWTHREPGARPPAERGALDRWLLSALDSLTTAVRHDMDRYDLTRAARRISSFVLEDLSNWYVRRSRDRFWATRADTERCAVADAFATLHESLATCSLLLAPFAPFLPDWLHRQLTGRAAHLSDYPEPRGRVDPSLEREMADVRRLAALGRAAREEAGVPVRQPLRLMRAILPSGREVSEELTGLLREELNVKRVVFEAQSGEIVRLYVKPDFGALGPRFGARTPVLARAVTALGDSEARRLRAGEEVEVRVDGDRLAIRPDEVHILEEAATGLTVKSDGGYFVGLDAGIDAELRAEGIARELVSRVQRLRREAGFHVADRIRLWVQGTAEVETAAELHRTYVAGETLAVEIRLGGGSNGESLLSEEVEIGGGRARIEVERV
ncbi:MAG: isoleucine--tRNA ligase [Gemmatimonadota bacterium]